VVIRATNPVIYLMMSAPNLAAAFGGLRRFSFVLQQRETRLGVADATESSALLWRGSPSRAYTDFTAGVLHALCQWVLGREVRPREVRLRHARPDDVSPYRARFGIEPTFGAVDNALVLRAADWDSPSVHGDRDLFELHRAFLVRSQEHLKEDAIVQRVCEELAQRLGVRPVELAVVAKALGMSARTLQRRLAKSDTRFADLLDEVRRRRVRLLLQTTDASLESVAGLAGFGDVRSMHRAVQRWWGSTPGAWRTAAQSARDGG
jgi:AraC-like DNA-binding protein